MPLQSYIIKFATFEDRSAFLGRVHGDGRLTGLSWEEDELNPLIAVWDVSPSVVERLRVLAGPRARFFEDIKFEPMSAPVRSAVRS